MKDFIKEFKTFAMRGNVIDLAVGVVIGGAFGKIVSSLVANVIMPPLGLLLGGTGRKRTGHRLWRFSQYRARVPDRHLRGIHRHQADQPHRAPAAKGCAAPLSILPPAHCRRCDALPALHLDAR